MSESNRGEPAASRSRDPAESPSEPGSRPPVEADAGADAGEAPDREAPEPPLAPEGAAPASHDDGFRSRHPNALKLELAVGGAVTGGLTLAALFVAAVLVGVADLAWWLMIAALAMPLALVLPLLVLPRWRHAAYRYRVDERGLEIRRGIWWRSHRFIPHTRLQHTDIAQGPLERQFGLANLVVHTAGTHEARTTVTGLSLDTARRLRQRLTEQIDAAAAGADGV